MQILLFGAPRSGTSLIARILEKMGIHAGGELAQGTEAFHFGERSDVRELHDRLLASDGLGPAEYGGFRLNHVSRETKARFEREADEIIQRLDFHRPWYLTESRLCFTVPLWLPMLERPTCLFVYRPPAGIVRALQTSTQLSASAAVAIWESYNLAALESLREVGGMQINYSELIADPESTVQNLARGLARSGIGPLRAMSPDEILSEIEPSAAPEGDVATLALSDLNKAQQELQRRLDHSIAPAGLEVERSSPAVANSLTHVVSHQDQVTEDEIADLKIRVRGAKARIAALSQTITQRDDLLAEQGQQLTKLTKEHDILSLAIKALEEHFRDLFRSRPLNFVIYSARRLGLVSRDSRTHAEAIRNLFPDVRKALKKAKKGPSSAADEDSRASAGGEAARTASELQECRQKVSAPQDCLQRRRSQEEKIAGRKGSAGEPLTLALAVTEASPTTPAGDFFTALELGDACRDKFGWRIRYLSQHNWYDLEEIDVLIVLVDSYDLLRIRNQKIDLIKVAWLRNWFERWASRSDFDRYNLYLCSSQKSATWLWEVYRKPAHLFRLATNPERFAPREPDSRLRSDYCFTGSNWQFEREITAAVRPEQLSGYRFAVYGHGWDSHPALGAYARGFVPYPEMPVVYASTQIVIDDANHVTRGWGSVNSRVFDALAAGALVISNGEVGATEVFGNALPIYHSPDDLQSQLRHYLGNEDERRVLVDLLRAQVLSAHTYRDRARNLQEILLSHARRSYRVGIKISESTRNPDKLGLDFHFARSLGRCLAAQGHSFRIDGKEDWDRNETFGDDVVIALNGAYRYRPRREQINLIWSFTLENITDQEYLGFNRVFVGSPRLAEELTNRLGTSVAVLFPCVDPGQFYPDPDPLVPAETLLVVDDCPGFCPDLLRAVIEGDLPVGVYGNDWANVLDSEHLRLTEVKPAIARQLYSRAEILLVEQSAAMREGGFVSRRLFEAAASGAFIISDPIEDSQSLFREDLIIHRGRSDLRSQIRFYLLHPGERRRLAERLRSRVLEAHSFANRTKVILAAIKLAEQSKYTNPEGIGKSRGGMR